MYLIRQLIVILARNNARLSDEQIAIREKLREKESNEIGAPQ
jgi:hypothetical protein